MATGRQPARDFGAAFSANADPSPLPRPDLSALRQRVADLEFVLRDLLAASRAVEAGLVPWALASTDRQAAVERAERVLRGEQP